MNVPAETPPLATPDPATTGTATPDPATTGTATPDPNATPTPELDENGNPKPLIEGEKPAANAEPEPFVPLTAEDITIPEGLEINEAIRDEALSIINNLELSPKEQLQSLIDLQGKLAKETSEAISETWATTQKAWQDEVKADTEIGGDKLPATLAAVNKLVTEYGSDKLVEAFALTGAGNNVHVIRFLNSIADKLLEGGAIPATAPTNQGGDAASRMFPSMKG